MPTIKQKKAFKAVGENGGNISAAMKSAGYSITKPNVSTEKLTNSKGWAELMEKFLSDKQLAKVHNRLLEKTEKIVVSDGAKEGSHIEDTGQPHSDTARALDMAYKMKKRYPKEGFTFDSRSININITDGKAKRILNRTITPGSEN